VTTWAGLTVYITYQFYVIKKKISKLKNNQFSKLGNIPFMTKSGGTKDHFRWVKVPGTTPY
jgi:hypothetical protein